MPLLGAQLHQGLAGIAPGRPETAKNVKKTP